MPWVHGIRSKVQLKAKGKVLHGATSSPKTEKVKKTIWVCQANVSFQTILLSEEVPFGRIYAYLFDWFWNINYIGTSSIFGPNFLINFILNSFYFCLWRIFQVSCTLPLHNSWLIYANEFWIFLNFTFL